MPDKKNLEVDKSPWINFMRAVRKKAPPLEHVSRKKYYPMVGPLYQTFKKQFENKYKISPKSGDPKVISFLKAFFRKYIFSHTHIYD